MKPTLTPDVKIRPYLTILPYRSPEQKIHTTLGSAKSAVSYNCGDRRGTNQDMAIYEWKNDEWVLLWEIPEGTMYEDLPWRKDV